MYKRQINDISRTNVLSSLDIKFCQDSCLFLGRVFLWYLAIASIARYHRKTLPKKRHESWQNLIAKEDKTLVLEMSLILRLAASLDQRPDKVISSVQIKLQENILTFELLPLNRNHDLLLEKWNLGLCRSVIREIKNLDLKVI